MALTIRAAAMAGAFGLTTALAAPAAAATPTTATTIAPVQGASSFDFSRYDAAGEIADWRRCRWGCGWGGRRGWRRNRVDAGDVLIGAAIIGGVAAILSSDNRRRRDRDVVIVERDRDIRDRDWQRDDAPRYRDDRRAAPRGTGASGLDNAVNICLDRIERDVRVDTVENVTRAGTGWQVSGVLFNGAPFQCRIGNGGQIDAIDYGEGFRDIGFSDAPAYGATAPAAGQWDDSRYASARAAVGGSVRPDIAVSEADMNAPVDIPRTAASTAPTTALPAYPGGPIPGETIPETDDSNL
ncbi:hypothetical protein [Erythrobacter donghaensis]|uniref:hypothetical protein n=1 Tax=Erythrobacter donghaensis TaxID=267135 RepID=UPI00117D9C76|nr:hypothetical protein [Erythrobacter donghaensis]